MTSYQQALLLYSTAKRREEKNTAYNGQKMYEDALEIIENLQKNNEETKENISNTELLYTKGLILHELGKYEAQYFLQAVQYLKSALSLNEQLVIKNFTYISNNEACKTYCKLCDELSKEAEKFFHKNNYAQAIRYYVNAWQIGVLYVTEKEKTKIIDALVLTWQKEWKQCAKNKNTTKNIIKETNKAHELNELEKENKAKKYADQISKIGHDFLSQLLNSDNEMSSELMTTKITAIFNLTLSIDKTNILALLGKATLSKDNNETIKYLQLALQYDPCVKLNFTTIQKIKDAYKNKKNLSKKSYKNTKNKNNSCKQFIAWLLDEGFKFSNNSKHLEASAYFDNALRIAPTCLNDNENIKYKDVIYVTYSKMIKQCYGENKYLDAVWYFNKINALQLGENKENNQEEKQSEDIRKIANESLKLYVEKCFSEKYGDFKITCFSNEDIKLNVNRKGKEKGKGGFGKVYKCYLPQMSEKLQNAEQNNASKSANENINTGKNKKSISEESKQCVAVKIFNVPKTTTITRNKMTQDVNNACFKEMHAMLIANNKANISNIVECKGIYVGGSHNNEDSNDNEHKIMFDNIGIIMPFIESNLTEQFSRITTMSLPARWKLLQIIYNTIIALHENNIAHGDIKLENIFGNEKLGYVLGDFGFAKNLQKNINTYRFKKRGTKTYLPLSVMQKANNYEGKETFLRKDIFAFTLLALQILEPAIFFEYKSQLNKIAEQFEQDNNNVYESYDEFNEEFELNDDNNNDSNDNDDNDDYQKKSQQEKGSGVDKFFDNKDDNNNEDDNGDDLFNDSKKNCKNSKKSIKLHNQQLAIEQPIKRRIKKNEITPTSYNPNSEDYFNDLLTPSYSGSLTSGFSADCMSPTTYSCSSDKSPINNNHNEEKEDNENNEKSYGFHGKKKNKQKRDKSNDESSEEKTEPESSNSSSNENSGIYKSYDSYEKFASTPQDHKTMQQMFKYFFLEKNVNNAGNNSDENLVNKKNKQVDLTVGDNDICNNSTLNKNIKNTSEISGSNNTNKNDINTDNKKIFTTLFSSANFHMNNNSFITFFSNDVKQWLREKVNKIEEISENSLNNTKK